MEQAITFVSKSSIKTSTEVAKLATTLFTLGKTKEEVKLLLAPVNNLAIAFRVSSDQAADFLGQTLNAFGKSAGDKFQGFTEGHKLDFAIVNSEVYLVDFDRGGEIWKADSESDSVFFVSM